MKTRLLITVGIFVAILSISANGVYGENHQGRNQHFGVSGGNVNDISKLYCCSGTLGALMTDGTAGYILSNNHVLARSDRAVAGEVISQPGLVDNACRPGTTVANFTVAPKLGSNVDAAIAKVLSGAMDSTGYIADIGTISSTLAAPSIGMAVEKSGRTTGLTSGIIGSINANVKVQYQKGCGTGKKFTVSYTGQFVISSSTFSAGGDSGSLIVTNNACHQPVGLLFAGSSTTTIANPISEVVAMVGTALGKPVSFVGGACTSGAVVSAAPSESLVAHAGSVLREQSPRWMSHGAVIGVGVGKADENPYEAVVVVYVNRQAGVVPQLPEQAGGVRVKLILTDPFIAIGCCKQCQ